MHILDFLALPQIEAIRSQNPEHVTTILGVVFEATRNSLGKPKKERAKHYEAATQAAVALLKTPPEALQWVGELIEACVESREAWLKGGAKPSKKKSTSRAAAPLADFQFIVDLWNAEEQLTKCLVVNDKRRAGLSKLALAIKNQEDWPRIIRQAVKCRFVRHEDGREWIPDIDWLLREGKAIWLLEKSMVVTADDRAQNFKDSLANGGDVDFMMPGSR